MIEQRPDWHRLAACHGLTGLFFPERGEPTREAKQVCAGCPVRTECSDAAHNAYEKHGIWGGLSERERRAERRHRTRTRECDVCGRLFDAAGTSAVTCSLGCRREAAATRSRAAHINEQHRCFVCGLDFGDNTAAWYSHRQSRGPCQTTA